MAHDPEEDGQESSTKERRRAAISPSLRRKAVESSKENIVSTNTLQEDALDANAQITDEMERFFVKKISVYRRDHELALSTLRDRMVELENELEASREKELAVLMRLSEAKARVKELEVKNIFYKNRLQRYEQ